MVDDRSRQMLGPRRFAFAADRRPEPMSRRAQRFSMWKARKPYQLTCDCPLLGVRNWPMEQRNKSSLYKQKSRTMLSFLG
jgi:hypothetical protein